jgi:hypothetical protein
MPDAVVSRLSEAIIREPGYSDPLRLILYLPFGVVRAEMTHAQVRAAAQEVYDSYHLITLHHAAVEHYSNHLPTGNYDTLHLNTSEIAGFVILKES